MTSSKRTLTPLYAAVQFFFWFAYGTAVNFASVYLLACGLSNTAIGLISAAACALSVLIQPILAAWADREESPSVKAILLALTAALLAFGGLLILAFGKGAALNGLFLGGAILLVQIGLPFVNALATESLNAGERLNFSLARGFGSIGYAVMSVSVGALIARFGPIVAPWAVMAVSGLLLMAVGLFPFAKRHRDSRDEKEGADGLTGFLRRYPAFALTLLGCVLIYTSHVLINSFVYQIVVSKGGNSEHMGIAMGLAGLLEVLSMALFSTLLKWKGSRFWFRISGLFFTLKALCSLLAPNMGAFYLVQLIQPLGWGLMTVASVYYVNEIMRERDRIKGQAYMTMALSVGTIVGSLCGGVLIDALGVNGMLIAAVCCGGAGSLIVLRKEG